MAKKITYCRVYCVYDGYCEFRATFEDGSVEVIYRYPWFEHVYRFKNYDFVGMTKRQARSFIRRMNSDYRWNLKQKWKLDMKKEGAR